MSDNQFIGYDSDSINTTPRRAGIVNVPHYMFNLVVNSINHRSHFFHTDLSTHDVLGKSISVTDFASLYAPRSFVVSGESNNRFEQMPSTMSPHECNNGDRFIPRRKGVNNDASHYRLMQKEEVKDEYYLDVFQEVTNATQHWRKRKMDSAFKVLGVFNGLQSNRVLNIGKSSSIDFKSLMRESSNDDCGWDCRARKQPLINLKGEDYESQRYRDHGAQIFRLACSVRFRNLIDWGAMDFLACGLADQFCICHVKNTDVYRTMYSAYVCNVKCSPDGTKIAVSGLGGTTSLYDRKYAYKNWIVWMDWTVRCQCYDEIESSCSVTCTEWSTKYNHVMTACDKGCLSIRNATDGKLIKARVFIKGILTISLSPTEQYLVVSGQDKMVKLFRYPCLTQEFEIEFEASIKAVAWHPWKTNILCLGGGPGDGSLSLWNVSSQRQLCYRRIKFVGSVEHLMFNKKSGELLVHWYFVDFHRSKLHSKIVVLSRLDKIVDAVPVHPDHRVLNIVWSPDHKRLAMQHRDALVIWDFFGNNEISQNKKVVKQQVQKSENNLRNYGSEMPASADLYSGLASSRRGKGFSYYNIR